MAFRHLETSLHRHHKSRLLRRPEDRLFVLRVIRLLETSLPLLRQVAFLDAQDVQNEFIFLSTP
jgi:hypothetical protein